MNGAEALIASLAREGVEVIFGLPGTQVMDVLDAIYRQQGIRWVTVRHEQAAAFMAYGYSRTTGKVGVALVVSGPGALYTTAALGTAYATSTPVLLVSGQVESYNLGQQRGSLHEMDDQLEVFRPLTKWCHRVQTMDEIPRAVNKAIHYLRTGRPRPVELEIPRDLMQMSAQVELPQPRSIFPSQPSLEQIRAAASLLVSAKRPLIWAGGGVIGSDASEALTHLAEHLNAPVIMTPQGKGAICGDHPLSLGTSYLKPDPALRLLPQADIILVVGSRFPLSLRTPWTPQRNQKVIQVDIDPAQIGRNEMVHLGIVADARSALTSLLEELHEGIGSTWQSTELEKIKATVISELEEVAPLQLSLIRVIHDELKEEGILVPGVTNIGYWSYIAYPVLRPRAYLTPSYFATLGYAFPTALGAKMGNPQRPVVALCGDGGFLYAIQELATAVREDLNVVALVFTDGAFGSCLRDQQRSYGNRIIGTRLRNPDFARLAEAFGAKGIKLSSPDELREGLCAALAEKRPTVVEVPVPNMRLPWEI